MKHAFVYWKNLEKRLKNGHVFLFLDYDGTLTPIVKRPDDAIIPLKTRNLLKRICGSERIKIAVISGRALWDIRKRVGLKDIIYAGNHGLEIAGIRKTGFICPISHNHKIAVKRIKKKLIAKLLGIKGAIIEDKGISLSVHYRMTDITDVIKVKSIVNEVAGIYVAEGTIQVKAGKKVMEIQPASEWNKGKIVLCLIEKRAAWNKKMLPLYLGDDATDEDAFSALKNKGLCVLVGGPRRTCAEYYLKNTREVHEFLERLLKIREDTTLCRN
ncbi:MAG: trehalose-phosphatase [Elusimicrobiota bacterium]